MQLPPREWKEIGGYIRSRRERTSPLSKQSTHGRTRTRPHLTQSELAELADVSTVLISKLEQGLYENINPGILRKISQALSLSADEEQFMIGLLTPAPGLSVPDELVPDTIREIIAATDHPTAILNPCFDLLAWNEKLPGFMGDFSTLPAEQRNIILAMFCNPDMRTMIAEWEESSRVIVASMKMIYALIPPYRVRIENLVSTVAAHDPAFSTLWNEITPRLSTNMIKTFNHPIEGHIQVNEMVSQIIGTPFLFRVEFVPITEASRQKMARL